jgi:hypothetical protein
MRLTMAHLREAAIIGGAGLMAFAVMYLTYLIGHDQFFMPGAISVIFMALWIFLQRRYEPRPRHPVDPRRRLVWFVSSIAAGGALAVFGLIAALWMGRTQAEPNTPCPARSSTNAVAPDDANTNGPAWRSAAAQCVQSVDGG